MTKHSQGATQTNEQTNEQSMGLEHVLHRSALRIRSGPDRDERRTKENHRRFTALASGSCLQPIS